MNNREWDEDINLTQEQLEDREWDVRLEEFHLRREERLREHREARALQGYFDIDNLQTDTVITNFPHLRNRESFDGILGPWTANKTWWICHNCGCMGFKTSECSELFKCSSCRHRNVQLVKAGELSMLIRNQQDIGIPIGINMEDVYEQRKERLRTRRRERSSQRS